MPCLISSVESLYCLDGAVAGLSVRDEGALSLAFRFRDILRDNPEQRGLGVVLVVDGKSAMCLSMPKDNKKGTTFFGNKEAKAVNT